VTLNQIVTPTIPSSAQKGLIILFADITDICLFTFSKNDEVEGPLTFRMTMPQCCRLTTL
jgi:hypothetical protein